MSGIINIFNIGKHGMMAQQVAMQVTSHNIANVNTEGYSRQEVILEEGMPLSSNPGQTGTGVNVSAIIRRYDSFIEGQLTDSKEMLGNLDVQKNGISKIEDLFYHTDGSGLNQLLDQFFNSMQDLSANPAGTAERVSVLSRADAVTNEMHSMYNSLEQLQKDMNSQIKQTVTDVNRLASQIASLNTQIQRAEATGKNANDIRDMRGRLLNDLAEKIDIQYFEDDSGQVTVIGGGMATLVEKGNTWGLNTVSNADNNGYYNIAWSPDGTNSLDITDRVSGGRINGFLAIRDTETVDAINELDRFAASVANAINQVHRTGFGLDGSTGLNLFSPGYEVGDELSVDLGEIKSHSTNTGTGNLSITIDDPSALTFNNYMLEFSGGNYTLTNTATNASTSAAYSGPAAFTFEGLSFTLSGAFASGDGYNISAHKNSARDIEVAIDVNERDKIAAAVTATGNKGDNRNALDLIALQDALIIDGNSSFSSYYGSMVGDIGVRSQYIKNQYSAQEFSSEHLRNMRESVSGVSLDEEMTNLMKYQLAYEASARLITIGNELFDALLGIIK
ncbi:MAG: flagellar hook-associated protein FlgK [Nitrospirae bacterium]|nr:flagellar hook-associated protein FlgK [Nitrospirota bacterium]